MRTIAALACVSLVWIIVSLSLGLPPQSPDANNSVRPAVELGLRESQLPCSAHCAEPNPLASQPDKDEEPATADFYDPVSRVVEGWTIAVDPALLEPEHEKLRDDAMEALANHLQRVRYILGEKGAEKLTGLPIWLELHNEKLANMQYHPSRAWLTANGHDPRLEKHVHIPRAKQLLARGMWAKHPYVVLHELAHAYHDQVLGFDDAAIVAAWKDAKERGIYERVLLYTGKHVRHYALTNHKEYFAESTEAYLGVNDFYPFVRAELEQHDPKMYALMVKTWGPVR